MPPLAELPAAYLAIERERDALRDELAVLKWQIEKLRRQVFGPGKGEKLDRLQLLLKLQDLEAELAAKAGAPRQEISYNRRAPIPRASLCEGIRIAAGWLQPICRRMHEHLLAGDYLQADETPVKCHDPDAGKGAVAKATSG